MSQFKLILLTILLFNSITSAQAEVIELMAKKLGVLQSKISFNRNTCQITRKKYEVETKMELEKKQCQELNELIKNSKTEPAAPTPVDLPDFKLKIKNRVERIEFAPKRTCQFNEKDQFVCEEINLRTNQKILLILLPYL